MKEVIKKCFKDFLWILFWGIIVNLAYYLSKENPYVVFATVIVPLSYLFLYREDLIMKYHETLNARLQMEILNEIEKIESHIYYILYALIGFAIVQFAEKVF